MNATLFCHARFLGASGVAQPGWLLVGNGIIRALGRGEPPTADVDKVIDAEGRTLAPGLIDVHVHGALGYDTMDATPEALKAMARFFAEYGVTGFLATTMSASAGHIIAALNNVATVMAQGTGGAALLGAHVEGPYINAGKRGCQDEANIRTADRTEYDAWLRMGVVRLITVAPETAESRALIDEAVERGVRVAAGHTLATFDQLVDSVAVGVSQVTHLFNAMGPLHHREPGAVGAALSHPDLYAQLIADGIHIHPAVLDLAIRAKGIERTILVTDAMAGAGMPDGDYDLGGVAVSVRDGVARAPDGALAGSTLTLDRAISTVVGATHLPLEQVWRMASAVPAEAMGWTNKGRLSVGCDADLVMVDDALVVCMTMVGGEVVYSR